MVHLKRLYIIIIIFSGVIDNLNSEAFTASIPKRQRCSSPIHSSEPPLSPYNSFELPLSLFNLSQRVISPNSSEPPLSPSNSFNSSPDSPPPLSPSNSSEPPLSPLNSSRTPLSPFHSSLPLLSPSNSSPSHRDSIFQQPLYVGAPISTQGSWEAIMEYSIENNLTYSATEKLLKLINNYCITPNNLLISLYRLKSHYEEGYHHLTRKEFCSCCNDELYRQQQCTKRWCKQSRSEVCQYLVLDFEDDLKQMYEGKIKHVYNRFILLVDSFLVHWHKLLYDIPMAK